MPNIEVNSGPHKKLSFIGHADAEAYDKQAGYVGACVESADMNDIWRGLLPEAHEKFADVLAKSGIVRGVNRDATDKAKARAKDGAKVADVPESYTTYANRVKATLEARGDEGKAEWTALDEEIHEVAAGMSCDSSPTARQKGPSKEFIAKAEDILTRDDDKIEATVGKMLAEVPGFDLQRDEAGKPERTSLARLVQDFVKSSL